MRGCFWYLRLITRRTERKLAQVITQPYPSDLTHQISVLELPSSIMRAWRGQSYTYNDWSSM